MCILNEPQGWCIGSTPALMEEDAGSSPASGVIIIIFFINYYFYFVIKWVINLLLFINIII